MDIDPLYIVPTPRKNPSPRQLPQGADPFSWHRCVPYHEQSVYGTVQANCTVTDGQKEVVGETGFEPVTPSL